MIRIGDLDAMLRTIETGVLTWIPRCTFFFGDRDEKMRAKSPPYVAWSMEAGNPTEETREIVEDDRIHYRNDMVVIVARCAGLVTAGMQGPDTRRQQLAASLQVFLAVSWEVARRHQGYGGAEDLGWKPVNPEGISDAYYPVDYTFRVRAGRVTPELVMVQPETQEVTVTLETTS